MEAIREYSKPAMKIVELRSNQNLSDTCWGYAANGGTSPVYYYEFKNDQWGADEEHPNGYGVGTWVGFQIKSGAAEDCKSVDGIDHFIVTYGPTIEGNEKLEALANTDLDAVLNGMKLYDNGGSPFKNTGTFANTVGKSW